MFRRFDEMFDDLPFVPRHTSSDLCDSSAKGHATPSFDHVFFFPFRFDRCLAPAWALTLTAALSTRNVCTEEVWVSMEVADVCEDGGVS